MRLKFKNLIYKSPREDFFIAAYIPVETITGVNGSVLTQVVCAGPILPIVPGIIYDVDGNWKKTDYGYQYQVSNWSEIVMPTREGIIGYLASGQIKGIGQKTAEDIYNTFGNDTLDILDADISRLKEVHGIGDKKLDKIQESYLQNRGARDIIAYLTPYGVTPRKAIKFYERFGTKTMSTVKTNPYTLTEIRGIGFKIADKIAIKMGVQHDAVERIRAGILFVLESAEKEGNMCLSRELLCKCAEELLTVGVDKIGTEIDSLTEEKKLVLYNGRYYKWENDYSEKRLAANIKKHLSCDLPIPPIPDIDMRLERVARSVGFSFAPEQVLAVKTALKNHLTIVTGGPGVGKTAIQRAMLEIYASVYPDNEIVCCAPTGKAARRMTESTGFESATIHKTIGLNAGDDGVFKGTKKLSADFCIVDEVSMMDNAVADALFRAFKLGCQIVLVGDVDQLPSVGAGCVLKDMIDSGVVPVVRLTRVFRQAAGSKIANNAAKMKVGNIGLEYSDDMSGDFWFDSSPDLDESAEEICNVYCKVAEEVGLDNVCYLTPRRKNMQTSVANLNPKLRDMLNPPSPDKPEIVYGDKVFRKGDKITQMRNHDGIANGDLGYIIDIVEDDGEKIAVIDFGDDRIVRYDTQSLEMIELAYALTIHKSQGGEFHTVIINLQKSHYVMLNRNLVYTAITRGKKRVIIIGDKRAMVMAIKTEATGERYTGLAKRLQGNTIDLFLEEDDYV